MTSSEFDSRELVIPSEVAAGLETQDELDAWVGSQIARFGNAEVWVRVPEHLPRREVRQGALIEVGGTSSPVEGHSLGGYTTSNAQCTGTNAPMNGISTRRKIVSQAVRAAIGAVASVGLFAHRGTEGAQACYCYWCGVSECYYNYFVGAYVVDCYYNRNGNCQGASCTLIRNYGCNYMCPPNRTC